MEISKEDHTALNTLEEALWRAESRFDQAFMNRIMAADFLEFGRSGRKYNKSDCLAAPKQHIDAVIPLADLNIRLLAEHAALITYNSEVSYGGTVEHARRSSVWTKCDGQWKISFHQGTPFTGLP